MGLAGNVVGLLDSHCHVTWQLLLPVTVQTNVQGVMTAKPRLDSNRPATSWILLAHDFVPGTAFQ